MSAERRTAAIVGCGDIAHHHVTGYQLEGVDIVAFECGLGLLLRHPGL